MAVTTAGYDELPTATTLDLGSGAIYRVPERRRAIFEVAPEILVALFKSGRRAYEVTEGAIPEGARVVGVQFDAMRDCWRICLEHESFDVVAEACVPPTIYSEVRIWEPLPDGSIRGGE